MSLRQLVFSNDSLYQGMEPTFWRHWWWNGGYFGSIFQVKALLPKATDKKSEMLNNLAAGTVGGFVGTVINTPFDVVKSRLQLKATGEWTYPALIRIGREEGLGALYKGFAPKVLRLAPGGGVLLLGEDKVLCADVELTGSRRGSEQRLQEAARPPLHLDGHRQGCGIGVMQYWCGLGRGRMRRAADITESGALAF